MGVNPQLVGKTYTGAPVYEVGREKIREFAEATRSTDPVHTDRKLPAPWATPTWSPRPPSRS